MDRVIAGWLFGTVCLTGCAHVTHPTRARAATEVANVASGSTRLLSPNAGRLTPPNPSLRAGQRHVELAVTSNAAPRQRHFQQPLVSAARTRAVVLLYHGFDMGRDPLSVSSANLDRQLSWLARAGIEIISVRELIEFLQGTRRLPERVATITIDDALDSVYHKAWPLLRRHQARFALGIPTELVEQPGRHPIMTWDQIREMADSGLCELASHGHSHRSLAHLSRSQLLRELTVSRNLIEQHTGQRPIALFYPLGTSSAEAASQVRASGYHAAFTATGGAIALGSASAMQLPRTSVFHRDSLDQFAWYFGDTFLQRLPVGWQPHVRLTASETTR